MLPIPRSQAHERVIITVSPAESAHAQGGKKSVRSLRLYAGP